MVTKKANSLLESNVLRNIPILVGGAILGGYTIKKFIEKLQNDQRRKALIEDLIVHDPIISKADRNTVLEYYATIYSIAPTVSLDKNTVRELLQSFIRFGRIDLNTVKLLSETERNITQSKTPFNLKHFI